MDLHICSSGLEEISKKQEGIIGQGMREFYDEGIGKEYLENHNIQMDIKMHISLTQLYMKKKTQISS